jgi:hypothetical protein
MCLLLTFELTKAAQRYTHLRTVVSEGNVGQSTNKQHRPGRGVVEIASGFYPALSLQPPFFVQVCTVNTLRCEGQLALDFVHLTYCWK